MGNFALTMPLAASASLEDVASTMTLLEKSSLLLRSSSVVNKPNHHQRVSGSRKEAAASKPATFMSLFNAKSPSSLENGKDDEDDSEDGDDNNGDDDDDMNNYNESVDDNYDDDDDDDEDSYSPNCSNDNFGKNSNRGKTGAVSSSSSSAAAAAAAPSSKVPKEKHQHHKVAKQKRCDCLKQGFIDLRGILPLDRGKSHSHMVVLKFTCNYIEQLRRENESLKERLLNAGGGYFQSNLN